MKDRRWKKGVMIGATALVLLLMIGGVVVGNVTSQTAAKKQSNTLSLEKASRDITAFVGLNEKEYRIGNAVPTFGGMFVDPEQSAIYVYTKNPEDAAKIKQLVSPYKGLKVKVLTANYTFKQLMTWKREVELKFDELGLTTVGIEESKNKLELGIETLNKSQLSAIKQELQKMNIPAEAVDIVETGPVTLQLSRQDRFNPLIGGIQIEPDSGGYCTLGFTARKNGVKGIVTAGHCADLNDDIYQPTFGWLNKIGSVAVNPSGPRWSDALWVPVSRNINYEVYPDYSVTGMVPSWNQYEGEFICKGGRTTGETCGRIVDTCTSISHPIYGTLYCQYFADYRVSGGDSGGPVYHRVSDSTSLYGVHWGLLGNTAIYSTVDEVFNDLGWMTIS